MCRYSTLKRRHAFTNEIAMRQVHIRKYRESDREFIVTLAAATQREMHRIDPDHHSPVLPGEAAGWFEEDFRRALTDGSIVAIAEFEGEAAGFVMAGLASEPWTRGSRGGLPAMKSGEIFELHVAKRYRRKGVGKVLLKAAEGELVERGCREVTLGHLSGNAKAAALFAASGYRPRWIVEVKRLSRPGR